MNRVFVHESLSGEVSIPSSKSVVHRLMICAALGDRDIRISCKGAGDDIAATADCLRALGADISIKEDYIEISPMKRGKNGSECSVLNCRESGSTLRFMLPVAAALGANASFYGEGRLSKRPLSPLYDEMISHGVELSEAGKFPLNCKGLLSGGKYTIDASVSSQFITGLLMALPVVEEDSELILTGKIESAPYIAITLRTLELFGIEIKQTGSGYYIRGGQKYTTPAQLSAEGDWSGAAFWIVAGCIGKSPVICRGVDYNNSVQGDKKVVDILKEMGAKIEIMENSIIAYPSEMHGIETDCSDIPDLVPILSVAASQAESASTFNGIKRLRLKESDRVVSTMNMLQAFGIQSTATDNSITIQPGKAIAGCSIDSAADHRIAASALVMSSVAKGSCLINNIECISKSYPDFCKDFINLGGKLEIL